MEERYGAAQAASDEWRRRAEWALRKGAEDLAREALKRRKTFEVRCLPRKATSPEAACRSMTCADKALQGFMMKIGSYSSSDLSRQVLLPSCTKQLHN